MANQIILKRSSTPAKVPTTQQLALGEIAINTHDGRIFIKKDDGTPTVVEIGGVTSVNGEIGSVTIDTGDVAENGNLYFTTARARTALSAGTGVSYNSSTGVISTTQNLSTAGTPTFAGLTLTGNVGITGDIIPSVDIQHDLGSLDKQWRDIYVGPGSLYVNGTKVLQDDTGTITFSADVDQNIRIKTLGNGILQLGSSTTNVNIDGTLQIASGKNITDSAGVEVNFGDNIDMNNNKVVGLGAPSANTDAATKGYVDSTVGALSTSSISQGNSNVTVVDTGTGQVLVTVDGSTALTVSATGVVIAGNMTVEGTTTTVNSNQLSIADNIITLNSDATGTPTQNSGIEVERGDDTNVQLRWNEGSDHWTFTNNGAVFFPIPTNTDDLLEGSTNLYHTATRARTSLSAGTSTGVSYNSSTGVISLGSIPNSSLTNNSITINGASVALGGTRTLDTDAVSEGSTNTYFTTARARSAISVSGSLAYNSTTGVISFTTPTTIASLSNHTTTNLAEGTNLYYTDARAVSANTTAIATAKSEAISAASSDATTKADAAQAAAVSAASSDATTKADAAQAAAVSAASSDATTKADAAQAAAVSAASSDATAKVAAEATARAAAITAAIATKDNTDEITEGTTNLYFTNARARGAVSAGTGISYNSTTGAITNTITQYTDALARGAVSFTAGSGAYNSTTGVFTIPTNTSQLTNGAAFITTAGARSAVSAGTGISYNSTTGVITNTITQYTDALAVSANSAAIATAKSEAISAAAADATTKADAAQAAAIDAVTGGAGAAFDTLKEIQDAMATDAELAAAIAAISNVPSATKLQTARTINGASFNGTANISFSTTAVAEGTNLYHTTARARTAVSFTAGSGAYNSTTGVFTIPTNTNQLTNGAGYITSSASISGSAATLTTGRTITLTGDVTHTSSSFNGSANITGTATLASVGTAGTYTKVTTDAKGRVTSGTTLAAADIPSLDASKITTGIIDAARLPSYVDDVLEFTNLAGFPETGETSKLYVALDTNKLYRWSGSTYIFITSGAVDSVAGKTGVVTLVKADVGLGNVDNTADSAKNVATAAALTTARTIGGVSFNGTANINLPGVNTAGNQNTSGNATTATTTTGNAGTATTLQTARTIQGVSFNGGANITVVTAGTGIGVSGTTVTNTLSTSGGSIGGAISTPNNTSSMIPFYYATLASLPTASNSHGAVAHAHDTGKMYYAHAGSWHLMANNSDIPTNTNQLTNGAGYITGITSGNVTTALGFTPYANNNPSGFITSSGSISGNAATATTATNAMNVAVTSSTTASAFKVPFANTTVSTTGNYGLLQDSTATFTYNPSTNTLVAGTFSGALSGNATTATTLQTARTIQGVSFNGGANITVVTAGTGISVSGTAVTNTLSTGGGSIGGAIAVTGAITATGEVTAFFSDSRLKTNIVPIADALDKVESISGYTFDPNETALALGVEDRHQMGVIAQEIELVAPELVCDSAFAGYKTVRYDKLTALLIEAVKELSAKVKTLEAQLGGTKPQL